MARLKLSPPWDIFYKELKCLFEYDSEIVIIFDEDNPEIKLCVNNDAKAYALSLILPMEKEFGGVFLRITVVPSNKDKLMDNEKEEISNNPYAVAFKGNPIVSSIRQLDTVIMGTITYVTFENIVVQYFNDNLYDINGICSTLYENIARKVLKANHNVHFCTDLINLALYKNNLNIND